MTDVGKFLDAFCRSCNGVRSHKVLAKETQSWNDDVIGTGAASWHILECAGCQTLGFMHKEWDSDDLEYNEKGQLVPEVTTTYYPEGPSRRSIKNDFALFRAVAPEELWLHNLYREIHIALEKSLFPLAAMGARGIIDYIVTARAGDTGNFPTKVLKLVRDSVLPEDEGAQIKAVFDTGSAVAHRGHRVNEGEAHTMLDVVDSLLNRFYIEPLRRADRGKEVEKMSARTPKRPREEKT